GVRRRRGRPARSVPVLGKGARSRRHPGEGLVLCLLPHGPQVGARDAVDRVEDVAGEGASHGGSYRHGSFPPGNLLSFRRPLTAEPSRGWRIGGRAAPRKTAVVASAVAGAALACSGAATATAATCTRTVRLD